MSCRCDGMTAQARRFSTDIVGFFSDGCTEEECTRCRSRWIYSDDSGPHRLLSNEDQREYAWPEVIPGERRDLWMDDDHGPCPKHIAHNWGPPRMTWDVGSPIPLLTRAIVACGFTETVIATTDVTYTPETRGGEPTERGGDDP